MLADPSVQIAVLHRDHQSGAFIKGDVQRFAAAQSHHTGIDPVPGKFFRCSQRRRKSGPDSPDVHVLATVDPDVLRAGRDLSMLMLPAVWTKSASAPVAGVAGDDVEFAAGTSPLAGDDVMCAPERLFRWS